MQYIGKTYQLFQPSATFLTYVISLIVTDQSFD